MPNGPGSAPQTLGPRRWTRLITYRTYQVMGKRKGESYRHKVTINAKARESDSRRAQQLRSIEVKRLQNNVEKMKQILLRYPKSGLLTVKKQKIDPLYDLKGAARPGNHLSILLSFTDAFTYLFTNLLSYLLTC